MESGQDWVWDGGRPSLDLVNTVRERWTGGRELLTSPAALVAWLHQAGLSGATAAATVRDLDDARRLREALDEGVRATLDARAADAGAVDVVNAWARKAPPPPASLRLGPHGVLHAEHPAPVKPVAAALTVIAKDGVLLLGTDDRARIRICASPDCSVRFVDLSQGRRRQWCSMQRCGNRAKARAHRRRSKQT